MTFRVEPAWAGRRLDQFVHEQLPQQSRAQIQEWIKAGRVRVNRTQQQKSSYAVRPSDVVDVEPADRLPLHAVPEEIPLTILYEDADLVAIDKPAGMTVHAGAGVSTGTVVNALLHRYLSLSAVSGPERPGIVHRLDRYTSGVLLVARHDTAHRALAEQFASRQVEKIYLALVHGVVKKDSDTIEKPIARDPVRRTRMTARLARGRTALTQYEVLRRYARFTYLKVRIGTGRTHQIRVHLSSLGHPVAGDTPYGAPARVEGLPPLGRYFLHAHRIAFTHPSTGERIEVESPLAPELAEWMNRLTI
jgi:23S rRNA pseudouridine1911/1915/1917 synthase